MTTSLILAPLPLINLLASPLVFTKLSFFRASIMLISLIVTFTLGRESSIFDLLNKFAEDNEISFATLGSLHNLVTSLANKILSKNKVPVFFIEKNKIDLIEKIKNQVPSAIFPELNSNLSCPALVTALASRLNIAVSIDNGVMHMMGLANIPMIVLFGPTDSEKFAPKINSIQILDSKKMYKSKNINTITVHDVFKLI